MASTRTGRQVPVAMIATIALIVVAACTTAGTGASAELAASGDASLAAPTASASSGDGYTRGDYGSGGTDDYETPPSAAPAASASASPVATAAPPAGGLAVATGGDGPYLTGDGLTLYTFDRDSTASSACADDCATNWPPLTVDGDTPPAAGDGISGMLTVFTRPDGRKQVAYNGRPLYFFAGDTAPGDTKGQGLSDVWFVAAP